MPWTPVLQTALFVVPVRFGMCVDHYQPNPRESSSSSLCHPWRKVSLWGPWVLRRQSPEAEGSTVEGKAQGCRHVEDLQRVNIAVEHQGNLLSLGGSHSFWASQSPQSAWEAGRTQQSHGITVCPGHQWIAMSDSWLISGLYIPLETSLESQGINSPGPRFRVQTCTLWCLSPTGRLCWHSLFYTEEFNTWWRWGSAVPSFAVSLPCLSTPTANDTSK